MAPKLRILKAEFRHLLGIAGELEIAPGKVTLIHGRNAVGKSSLLVGLQVALGGGNLARLARVDAQEGETPEVVVVLAQGGQETRLERKGDKLRVRTQIEDTAGLEDVRKPQAWLSSHVDSRGWNPLDFIQADDKTQTLLALEAIALPFDRAETEEAVGVKVADFGPLPEGLAAFDALAMVRQYVFDRRTAVNRDAKTKGGAAEQLRRSIPAAAPPDLRQKIDRLDEHVSATLPEIAKREMQAVDRMVSEQDRITWDTANQVRGLRSDYDVEAAKRRAALEAELSHMKDATEKAVSELHALEHQALEALEAEQDSARLVISEAKAALSRDRESLISMRAQAEAAAKGSALREQAETFEVEAGRLTSESERLTVALENLDAYRRALAARIPVPGLAIEGGTVTVDGVPFRQVNTARQYDVGVQLAILRAKRAGLPCVFVDRAESLDSTNLALLIDRLKAADVVAFVARVDETPGLTVEEA